MQNSTLVSIVVPLLNEEESIVKLSNWIFESLRECSFSFEIIFVDDGSEDSSWDIVIELSKKFKNINGISFKKNYGKSQALHAGFKNAKGNFIVTLDADLQDSPEEIPRMIKLLEDGYDLVSGWKKKRYDSILFKNLPSKLFNWAARRVSGIKLHDFNCGIKAYKNEVVKSINIYGELHRFIPVLAAQKGFNKIGEQIVKHQARQYGKTKFGSDRFFKGFFDLLTIWFIYRFGKRPMHFFGLWGSLMLLIGFAFTAYLGIEKLFLIKQARLITSRPEFYISLTLMLLGSQFFIAGFLGEIILKNGKTTSEYKIKEHTL